MTNRNKEDAVNDFLEMIYESWTYNRLTEDEKYRFDKAVTFCTEIGDVKGTWKQRWSIMQMVYEAFLDGVGYDGPNWREEAA